ncbi:epoxide hydrolase domain-containing protein [Mycena floridula]|nr:epoxide hydrolase domain-containing protein [Mycena floridula]
MSVPKPFTVNPPQETVDWISQRVKTARIIPDVTFKQGSEWDHGTPSYVMEELVEYWRTEYDWKKVEAKINSTYQMFTVDLTEGDEVINLHFVHHPSSRENAVPLLFCHGWPGNFTEVEEMLKLAEPEDPEAQAFHVVAPSIPGFTFSSAPKKPNFSIARTANIYYKLMETLGYPKFVGQGGDIGSFILRSMACQFPDQVIGIHLNFIISTPPSPFKHPLTLLWLALRWFTPSEKAALKRLLWFQKEQTGYMKIQGTKPQTVSYGLMDSPVGMLAWIREKIQLATEPDYVWDKEVIITWVTLYLLSGNASNARIYKDGGIEEVMKQVVPKQVAFGGSCFPMDVGFIPRWWAQVSVAQNIIFWRENTKGGHFASLEVPDLLKLDFLEFYSKIPTERRNLLTKL